MTRQVQDAYIVAATRTPIGKAPQGRVPQHAARRSAGRCVAQRRSPQVPSLDPKAIEDAIIGCAMPEAEQGLNVARIAVLLAGLPNSVGGVTINRFCSSGLHGRGDGGRSHPRRRSRRDDRRRYGVDEHGADGRQQAVVQRAHLRERRERRHCVRHGTHRRESGAAMEGDARDAGRVRATRRIRRPSPRKRRACFADEMTPIDIVEKFARSLHPRTRRRTRSVDLDEGPRARHDLEALAKLRAGVRCQRKRDRRQQLADIRRRRCVDPRFRAKGGQAVQPDAARALCQSFAIRGVPPEIMGIGPKEAIPVALTSRRS